MVPTVGAEGRILVPVHLEEPEEEVDEFPVPVLRIPKAHRAYGGGFQDHQGSGSV